MGKELIKYRWKPASAMMGIFTHAVNKHMYTTSPYHSMLSSTKYSERLSLSRAA